MVLVRVELYNPCYPDEFMLIYACSKCGTDLHDYMKHRTVDRAECPLCGHVLDKIGKPHLYLHNLEETKRNLTCKEVADKFSEDARGQRRTDFEMGEGYNYSRWYEVFPWKYKGGGKYGNYAYSINDEVLKMLNEDGYEFFHKKKWDEYYAEQAAIAAEQAKNNVV